MHGQKENPHASANNDLEKWLRTVKYDAMILHTFVVQILPFQISPVPDSPHSPGMHPEPGCNLAAVHAVAQELAYDRESAPAKSVGPKAKKPRKRWSLSVLCQCECLMRHTAGEMLSQKHRLAKRSKSRKFSTAAEQPPNSKFGAFGGAMPLATRTNEPLRGSAWVLEYP